MNLQQLVLEIRTGNITLKLYNGKTITEAYLDTDTSTVTLFTPEDLPKKRSIEQSEVASRLVDEHGNFELF
jgi:hypothetical protein